MILLLLSSLTTDWVWLLIFTRFLDHTQRRTTVGRTPLDEWPARRRGLYLTTHNTHNIQTSMPPVGFEPTTPVGELSQTYALDRAATGTGLFPHMLGVVVFIDGDANVNNSGRRKRIYPSTGLRATCLSRLPK